MAILSDAFGLIHSDWIRLRKSTSVSEMFMLTYYGHIALGEKSNGRVESLDCMYV